MVLYRAQIRDIDSGKIVADVTRKRIDAAQLALWRLVYRRLEAFGKLDTAAAWECHKQCFNFSSATVSKGFHISNTGYAARFTNQTFQQRGSK